VRFLLDSHVALWWLAADPTIGVECRRRVDTAAEVLVSVITPWELGVKRALGKVDYPDGLVDALRASGFDLLAVTAEHAELAPTLPPHHRDPFDRMLVAQAQLESLVVVSADESLVPYAIERLDPRT
jgi:PIN domain nuclease of toxin-antitoxin system